MVLSWVVSTSPFLTPRSKREGRFHPLQKWWIRKICNLNYNPTRQNANTWKLTFPSCSPVNQKIYLKIYGKTPKQFHEKFDSFFLKKTERTGFPQSWKATLAEHRKRRQGHSYPRLLSSSKEMIYGFIGISNYFDCCVSNSKHCTISCWRISSSHFYPLCGSR